MSQLVDARRVGEHAVEGTVDATTMEDPMAGEETPVAEAPQVPAAEALATIIVDPLRLPAHSRAEKKP